MDCKSGNFKCSLGQLGCNSVQISGQPASCVETTQNTNRKCECVNPILKSGKYDLMIIGEMPSIEDDKLNMAWADNSGNHIINYLKKAGHDLTRVWMTRIVKCRPNIRGRKPSTSEINICRDNYLRKEIEIIQPKVIMLVGSAALKAFNLTGKGSLNAIHGRVFDLRFAKQKGMTTVEHETQPIYKVIPTINPATFFYNPNKKLQARIGYDYVIAKAILEGKEPPKHFVPNYHLIDTPEKLKWLEEKLLNSNMIAFDTESGDLNYRKSPLLSIQFSWDWNECAVIPIMQHDETAPDDQEFHVKPGLGVQNEELVTEFMRKVFLTPNITKAGHNIKYDAKVIRWNYGIIPEGFWADSLLMKSLLDENPPSDLEALLDINFLFGDYAAERRAITGSGKKLKNTFDKVPDKVLWQYGSTDALGSFRLACLYYQQLQEKPNLWNFYCIELEPLQKSLTKAEYHGTPINTEVIEILGEKYEKEQKELLTKIRKVTSKPDFNPSSDKQVLAALLSMEVSQEELKDNRNSSGLSSGKKQLLDIAEKGIEPASSFARDIIQYRNKVKMITTYLENCKENIDNDGRVRFSFNAASVVTGRLAAPFYHQIPKIDENIICSNKNNSYIPFDQRLKNKKIVMRDLITAPSGYQLVYGDFSQIELRIMAIISQDHEMLRILSSPNSDLHQATAFEFLKNSWPGLKERDISKFNRVECGKRINFGLIYRSSGYELVRQGKWLDWEGKERSFTWDMLNEGMINFRERFIGVTNFIENIPNTVRSFNCTAQSVFGRQRRFLNILNSSNERERAEAERQCINFFVQSPAASITNRTIVETDKILEQFHINENIICLLLTVHDSVLYCVQNSYVSWFIETLRLIAERPHPELNNSTFKFAIGSGISFCEAEINAE